MEGIKKETPVMVAKVIEILGDAFIMEVAQQVKQLPLEGIDDVLWNVKEIAVLKGKHPYTVRKHIRNYINNIEAGSDTNPQRLKADMIASEYMATTEEVEKYINRKICQEDLLLLKTASKK